MRKPLSLRPGFVRTALAGVLLVANAWFPASAAVPVSEPRTTFQPCHARFGRERPVIAVVGDHHGTGLTDLATHDSEVFRPELGVNLRAFAATYLTNRWFHGTDRVGIAVDHLALAMTADAYSRTGRSQAFAFAASRAPTPTRAGLVVLPEQAMPATNERTLPALQYGPGRPLFDQVLASIETRYGRSTARGLALAFVYPRPVK